MTKKEILPRVQQIAHDPLKPSNYHKWFAEPLIRIFEKGEILEKIERFGPETVFFTEDEAKKFVENWVIEYHPDAQIKW